MRITKPNLLILAACLVALSAAGWAQQGPPKMSDFIENVPELKPAGEDGNAFMWEKPGLSPTYDRVIVDQPEIFIDPESKYKGLKPDALKVLADSYKEDIQVSLTDLFQVVDQPGTNTVYLRSALTNVYIKKKGRPFWSFTPAGFAVHEVKSAIGKKVVLLQANVEVEALDSQTGERLGVYVVQRGQRPDKDQDLEQVETSWDDITAAINEFGQYVAQRMEVARARKKQ